MLQVTLLVIEQLCWTSRIGAYGGETGISGLGYAGALVANTFAGSINDSSYQGFLCLLDGSKIRDNGYTYSGSREQQFNSKLLPVIAIKHIYIGNDIEIK